ncbi:DUF2798 domain-containing protein [Oligella urethralis]|uniref:DUF2798 domain-containing protein n=1 Tax=Oligella urethralis TaxID=90245 RepID=UPI00288B7F0F|nr:DUF2798 domain-containing protein [Oligella urethralis]
MKKHTHFFFGLLPKLPASSIHWLMPLLLSGIMSGVVSAYNTIKNLGLVDGIFPIWLNNWLQSWLIAFPLVLVILPILRCVVGTMIYTPTKKQ